MGYDGPHQHRARTKPERYLFLRTPHGHSPNKNMVHRPHQPGPKKNPGKPQRKPLRPSDGAFTNAAPRRYLCANCATRSTEKRLRSSPTSILPSGRRTMHSAFPPPRAARSKILRVSIGPSDLRVSIGPLFFLRVIIDPSSILTGHYRTFPHLTSFRLRVFVSYSTWAW